MAEDIKQKLNIIKNRYNIITDYFQQQKVNEIPTESIVKSIITNTGYTRDCIFKIIKKYGK